MALASDGKASSGAVCELETGALGHRRHATDLAPRAETDEGVPRLLRSVGDELLSQRGGLRSSCGSGAQECSPSFSDPGAAWTVAHVAIPEVLLCNWRGERFMRAFGGKEDRDLVKRGWGFLQRHDSLSSMISRQSPGRSPEHQRS